MRLPFAILVLSAGALIAAGGQSSLDPKLQAILTQIFPIATSFSPKGGDPPHFTAYVSADGTGPAKIAGFAFWTTELDPLERGYDGPIKILVGMDTKGVLTGIAVVEHHEPYGSFSIDPPAFAAQFKRKSIGAPFKVGMDVDAVSRASISIGSATRAIRNSARRVARQLLAPEAVK